MKRDKQNQIIIKCFFIIVNILMKYYIELNRILHFMNSNWLNMGFDDTFFLMEMDPEKFK